MPLGDTAQPITPNPGKPGNSVGPQTPVCQVLEALERRSQARQSRGAGSRPSALALREPPGIPRNTQPSVYKGRCRLRSQGDASVAAGPCATMSSHVSEGGTWAEMCSVAKMG